MKKLLGNGYKKFDYSSDLHKIACPTLWLAGEYDPIHPPSGMEAAVKQMQNVESHILNAGDPVYQDQPEEFYQLVCQFFEKKLDMSRA